MSEEAPVKTHVDYAHELDVLVKPEALIPGVEREAGSLLGSGFPLFSIGGGYLRQALSWILLSFHSRRGYYIVDTPSIASSELFQISGHMDFYRKNMFVLSIEEKDYVVKPMNCPFHILIFLNELGKRRGRLKLPFKIFELGRVHRYEPSGTIHGLLRVRGFTQDDAHIVVEESQTAEVVLSVFEEMRVLLEEVFSLPLGSENARIRVSVSDKSLIGKDFMGSLSEWEHAEDVLEKVARHIEERYGVKKTVGVGEAAFYGPKIDFMLVVREASVVKEWQMGTIQFDFNLPRRFNIEKEVREVFGDVRVYLIHRALLGSLERFLGGYLEYSRGRLPFPLAPLQIAVLAIKGGGEEDREIAEIAEELKKRLASLGFRVGVAETSKTGLSGAVRQLESTLKPPIVVYVGAREARERFLTVSVYSMRDRRREQKRVRYETLEDAVSRLEELAEQLEEGVVRVSGARPRLPADLSFLL
ncbi:MAG: aminoacyl--tRNA ligase-related protein [Acidilobaceae archaeon]